LLHNLNPKDSTWSVVVPISLWSLVRASVLAARGKHLENIEGLKGTK
jgi:hypothetical protein